MPILIKNHSRNYTAVGNVKVSAKDEVTIGLGDTYQAILAIGDYKLKLELAKARKLLRDLEAALATYSHIPRGPY